MPRIARIILPGTPHHVTQRGNRRQQTFFCESDYQVYLELLSQWSVHYRVTVNAYCLMPNHVHLIITPADRWGLTAALTEIHRRYTQRVNRREGWLGHLWQGRFFSVPLDEPHYDNARHYVELNPVRAGLVASPEAYPWSSAFHSIEKPERLDGWNLDFSALRKMTATGRPEGSETFYDRIFSSCGIDVRRRPPGRPRGSRNR